jgi:alanine dehydrogenase
MPGAVPKTSTYALANATFPYLLQIADRGYVKAGRDNSAIAHGINLVGGKVTSPEIAQLFQLKETEISKVLW